MTGIEVFQDLYLRHQDGPTAVRHAVLGQLEWDNRWVHTPAREDEIRTPGELDVISLERPASEDEPGVGLWLFEEPDGGYKVSNIVPLTSGELGTKGYNNALVDFVRSVVKPARAKFGLKHDLSAGVETLDDWVAPDTADALKRFSKLANKSTGRSHPLDGDRWMKFLISAHLQKAELDSEQLFRWLVEVEKWPAETAMDLASEYDHSRTLLATYDENH